MRGGEPHTDRTDGLWTAGLGAVLTGYAWYAKLMWRQVDTAAFAGPLFLAGGVLILVLGSKRIVRPVAAGERWYIRTNRRYETWTGTGCLVFVLAAAVGAGHVLLLLNI